MTVDRTDLKNAIYSDLVTEMAKLGGAPDPNPNLQALAQALVDALMDHFLAKMTVSVSVTVGSQTGTGSGTVS